MRQRACFTCGATMVRLCPNGCDPSRSHRAPMYDTPEWRKLRRVTLARHRATVGEWCPGFRRPGHPSADLTVDHVIPGTTAGGVQVLCRSCNSRKRAVDTPTRRRA